MNCKPGDIAIQVSAWSAEGLVNVGALYEVLERSSLRDDIPWRVRTLTSATLFRGTRVAQRCPPGTIALCNDQHLRPLQKPPEDEIIDEEAPIPTERTI